jgi:hypothetical protein
MSVRTWLYVFTLGLILAWSGQAWSQPTIEDEPIRQNKQEDGSTNGDAGTQNDVTRSQDVLLAVKGIETAIRDLIAEEDQAEADRQRQNESRDLNAQEAMAKWALWMVWVTAGTAALTFLSLILIGFTLRYTRKAAEHTEGMLTEARSTTKAANETVALTRQMGFVQSRAYVGFSEMVGKLTPDGRIVVWAQIRNAGQTPATRVMATLEAHVIDGDELGSFNFSKNKYTSQNDIYPGDMPRIADYVALEGRNVHEAVKSGEVSIEIVGLVSYRDNEGRTRRTLTHGQIHSTKCPVKDGTTYMVASAPRGNRST